MSLGTLYGRYEVKKRHPYVLFDKETGEDLKPPGVTTLINQTLSKGDRFSLWPLYEAVEHMKGIFFEGASFTGSHVLKELEIAQTVHRTKSTDGKDIGTEVHKAIEDYLNNIREKEYSSLAKGLSKRGEKAYLSFVDWFLDVDPEILETEKIVFSPRHFYAGTYDFLARIDNKLVLCDVKTSNKSYTAPQGIYDSYFLQLGAYSIAHHEELVNPESLGGQLDDVMIINVGKDGSLHCKSASDLGLSVPDCEAAFLSLAHVYEFRTPLSNKLKEGK